MGTGESFRWNSALNSGTGGWEAFTPGASTGVSSIVAGMGLTGGTITTSGTIAVDVGITTGKILQVAAANKLPAIDGSNLTNIKYTSLVNTFSLSPWPGATCTAGQAMTWSSVSDSFSCTSLVVSGASFASQSANLFLGAPNGSAGSPSFRGIVGADLPAIDLAASGAGGVTGTLPVANGGTGTTNGSITGTGALTLAAGGTNQNVILSPSGTGNVGIGTSSPGARTHVYASAGTDIARFESPTGFWLFNHFNALQSPFGEIIGWDSNVSAGSYSSFSDTYITSGWGVGTSHNIILKPSGSGKVEVGTASPSAHFSVSGGTTGANNAYFFYDNPQVADGVHGQSVYIYRRGSSADTALRLFANQWGGSTITSLSNGIGTELNLEGYPVMTAEGLYVSPYCPTCNSEFRIYGNIVAAGTSKFIQFNVNKTTGNFVVSREDANLNYFNVNMPAIFTGGNVGIGVTGPTYQLQLSTDSAAKPGTNTWTVASDRRLKNINQPFIRGLESLEQIQPVYFNYKKDNELNLPTDKEYVGLIAQEAKSAIPESVTEDEKGFLHITADSIIWTMLNSIKELKTKGDEFKEQNEELKTQNKELNTKSEELKLENQILKSKISELSLSMQIFTKALCQKDSSYEFCSSQSK